MNYKYCFLSLLFAFHTISHAQESTNIDSLLQVYKSLPNDTIKVNIIDDIFRYYRKSDTSKLLNYAQKQLALSREINFKKGIGQSLHNYARFYYNRNENDSAKVYYAKALKKYEEANYIKGQSDARWDLSILTGIVDGPEKKLEVTKSNIEFYEKIKDSFRLANSYYDESLLHFENDHYRLALNKSLKALKYFERKKDSVDLSDMYKVLSMIECELHNNNSALEYAVKSLNLSPKKNKHYVAGMYNTIGIIYTQQREFTKVDSIFKKATQIADELDWAYMKKLILVNHSRSYEDRGDFSTALDKMRSYINIEKNNPDKTMSSLGQLGMGSALIKLNRAKEAKPFLDNALVAAKNEGVKRRMILTYQNRAEAHAKLNDYKKAYEDHKMYAKLKDSVYNETKSQQIEEMRAIFDTEKKEQEIINQKNEIELLTVKGKVNNLQKLLLALGFVITLISTYALFQRNKRNRLEKEKVKADLVFKTKELTTHALHLAKKNEVLNDLKEKAKILKSDANADPGYQMLIQTINFDLQDDNNWENFSKYFEQVHQGFNTKAQEQFPNVTSNDLRLMALLKMNLSSKEIANILNISSDGIKKARQRLRKKMGIDSNESLEAIVIAI